MNKVIMILAKQYSIKKYFMKEIFIHKSWKGITNYHHIQCPQGPLSTCFLVSYSLSFSNIILNNYKTKYLEYNRTLCLTQTLSNKQIYKSEKEF